jgi:hypothetical protein
MKATHSALAIGLMAAFGLTFPQHASAASITWTGLNGFWENGANWSGGIAPTAADQATTAAGVVISSEATNSAQELFNNANVNVAKDSLTVGGTIENNKNTTNASLMTSLGGTASANRILNYGGVVVSDGLGSTLTTVACAPRTVAYSMPTASITSACLTQSPRATSTSIPCSTVPVPRQRPRAPVAPSPSPARSAMKSALRLSPASTGS